MFKFQQVAAGWIFCRILTNWAKARNQVRLENKDTFNHLSHFPQYLNCCLLLSPYFLSAVPFSKSTINTSEQCVKSVQS